MQSRMTVGGAALALLVAGFGIGPAPLQAQWSGTSPPLAPVSPGGRPVAPFMEGWYANPDGSYTISFGYLNMNDEDVLYIPTGENNYIEPEAFGAMPPTVFLSGRHRGVFGVTMPAEMAENDESIWWRIISPSGDTTQVPGRITAHAYELDYGVRPQGSEHPLVWFEDEDAAVKGPGGIVAGETLSVAAGEPLEITINTRDPSERDPEDPRFREAVPVRVQWFRHQGPGEVEFIRHENHPLPEPEEEEDEEDSPFPSSPPGPEEITLEEGFGTAYVLATFSEPGEYVLRAQVDNWDAPDSSSGDQCCWTNGFLRVNVTP